MITDDNYLEFLNSIPELTDKQKASEELIFNVTEDILLAMQDAGFTQSQLANALGKSKAHVSSLLSGERNMTLKTLSDINYALGTNIRITILRDGVDVSLPLINDVDLDKYFIAPSIFDREPTAKITVKLKTQSVTLCQS